MFSKFSVKKPMTVFVAVIIVIILGVVSFTNMTPDLLPNMDFPYVVVMTTYPAQALRRSKQPSPSRWSSRWLRSRKSRTSAPPRLKIIP